MVVGRTNEGEHILYGVLPGTHRTIFLQPEDKSRHGRANGHASNAHVNLFLAWVKSVANFTLFCHGNKLCCNFALCRVILMAFKLVNC